MRRWKRLTPCTWKTERGSALKPLLLPPTAQVGHNCVLSHPPHFNTDKSQNQHDKYDHLHFDPFPGQGDEETPNTFSLFEEKYLSLDEIPAHLKRVGGLKDLISNLFLEASKHMSNPGVSWGNLVDEHVPSLMFLYLHITSSPFKDPSPRVLQFAHLLASTLRAFFSSHTASTIHFPHLLIRVFELDLLKRILPSNNAQSTLQYDLGIMKFLPTDHFRDQHFALCAGMYPSVVCVSVLCVWGGVCVVCCV